MHCAMVPDRFIPPTTFIPPIIIDLACCLSAPLDGSILGGIVSKANGDGPVGRLSEGSITDCRTPGGTLCFVHQLHCTRSVCRGRLNSSCLGLFFTLLVRPVQPSPHPSIDSSAQASALAVRIFHSARSAHVALFTSPSSLRNPACLLHCNSNVSQFL